MPLPDHALIIHGGCNCRAIRYKILIPSLSDRPPHPYAPATSTGTPVHLPFITTDHCNDCRLATGSILPSWICAPTALVSASCVPRPVPISALNQAPTAEEARGPWRPGAEVFKATPASSDTYLMYYESSDRRTRSFCGRCGTNLAFVCDPMLEGWPDMVDLLLGTVDRADLESQWMRPERQLWWSKGIAWVQEFASEGGRGLPKHPGRRVDEVVD